MTYRYMKNNNLGVADSSYYIFSASLEAGDNNEALARTILEDVLETNNDDSFQDVAPSMSTGQLSKISKALNDIEVRSCKERRTAGAKRQQNTA